MGEHRISDVCARSANLEQCEAYEELETKIACPHASVTSLEKKVQAMIAAVQTRPLLVQSPLQDAAVSVNVRPGPCIGAEDQSDRTLVASTTNAVADIQPGGRRTPNWQAHL